MLDILVDQFLEDPEEETHRWVRRHQPQVMEEALQLAEAFMMAEKVGTKAKGPKPAGTLTKSTGKCGRALGVPVTPSVTGSLLRSGCLTLRGQAAC